MERTKYENRYRRPERCTLMRTLARVGPAVCHSLYTNHADLILARAAFQD
jgi:hypothetical protein